MSRAPASADELIIIFPGIVITFLSFTVFYAPTSMADPLGFGISVIVVSLLGNLVLISILPICGEMLWINIFSLVNTAFTFIALCQSTVCIMIDANEGEHLFPEWMVQASFLIGACALSATRRTRRLGAKVMRRMMMSPAQVGTPTVSSDDSSTKRGQVQAALDAELVSGEANVTQSIAGVLFREMPAYATGSTSEGAVGDGSAAPLDDRQRLRYFEKIFFDLDALDSNLDGRIDQTLCKSFFSFVLLDMTDDEVAQIFQAYTFRCPKGGLNRMEFVQVCKDCLWSVPHTALELSLVNLTQVREARKERYAAHWKELSSTVDRWSGRIIPLAYVICLLVIFHIDLTDDYTRPGVQMFLGLGPVTLNDTGKAQLTFCAVFLAIGFGLFSAMKRHQRAVARRRQLKAEQMLKAQRHAASGGDSFQAQEPIDGSVETLLPLGPLKNVRMPGVSVRVLTSEELQLQSMRFEKADEITEGASLPVNGPAGLLRAYESVGMLRSQLVVRLSARATVNLPIADRLKAGIPIPAASFSFVYPPADSARLSEADLSSLAEWNEPAVDLLLHGGFAYLDQAGMIIGVNAIIAVDTGSKSHFFFNGPFPMPARAHDELALRWEHLARFGASTVCGDKSQAQSYAWIRPGELAGNGVVAPFGAFSFFDGTKGKTGEDAGCSAYFRLIPSNVPKATILVGFDGNDGQIASSDGLDLMCPLRTRVADLKQIIEAYSGAPKPSMVLLNRLTGEPIAVTREEADPAPIEEFGLLDGDTLELQCLIGEAGEAARKAAELRAREGRKRLELRTPGKVQAGMTRAFSTFTTAWNPAPASARPNLSSEVRPSLTVIAPAKLDDGSQDTRTRVEVETLAE